MIIANLPSWLLLKPSITVILSYLTAWIMQCLSPNRGDDVVRHRRHNSTSSREIANPRLVRGRIVYKSKRYDRILRYFRKSLNNWRSKDLSQIAYLILEDLFIISNYSFLWNLYTWSSHPSRIRKAAKLLDANLSNWYYTLIWFGMYELRLQKTFDFSILVNFIWKIIWHEWESFVHSLYESWIFFS